MSRIAYQAGAGRSCFVIKIFSPVVNKIVKIKLPEFYNFLLNYAMIYTVVGF